MSAVMTALLLMLSSKGDADIPYKMVKKWETLFLSTTIKEYSRKRRGRNGGILVPKL
jgi:hypothetical protein